MDRRQTISSVLSSWRVRCRDERGARAEIEVRLVDDTLVLCSKSEGPLTLTPLQAGRLRGAVREALLTLDRDATADQTSQPTPATQPAVSAQPTQSTADKSVPWSSPLPRPLST